MPAGAFAVIKRCESYGGIRPALPHKQAECEPGRQPTHHRENLQQNRGPEPSANDTGSQEGTFGGANAGGSNCCTPMFMPDTTRTLMPRWSQRLVGPPRKGWRRGVLIGPYWIQERRCQRDDWVSELAFELVINMLASRLI
ncbi:MAG TPA: hypothetical protein VN777_09290 [Terriglobales bacterium]|nr:hypothetical protein [Terriglobales bacterium]HZW92693.1 hypothetical protein [Candidatus Eremiobacteraceae bacterium]